MAESSENQPKRCTCGFWGSSQTMNLCSKCYKEYLQNMKASKAEGGGASQDGELLHKYFPEIKATPEESSSDQKEEEGVQEEERMEEGGDEDDPFLPSDRPVQNNRKRCWTCRAKLMMAQRELGSCKCGYVFCLLHRLPEQHSCIYDHKEGGRHEAMKNMVPASRKKIGRSFHRMDSQT